MPALRPRRFGGHRNVAGLSSVACCSPLPLPRSRRPPGPYRHHGLAARDRLPLRQRRDPRPPPRAGRGAARRARPGGVAREPRRARAQRAIARAARRRSDGRAGVDAAVHPRRGARRARSASRRTTSPRPSPPCASSPPPTTRTPTRPAPTRRSRRLLALLPARRAGGRRRSASRSSSRPARRRPRSSAGMTRRSRGARDTPPVRDASARRTGGSSSSTSPGTRSAPGRGAVPARRTPARSSRGPRGLAMSAFADLHRPGDPLRAARTPGTTPPPPRSPRPASPAIGTTSLGVAAALGLRDGAAETAEATIDLAHRLAHLPVPVTIDIENGFSNDPAEVAAYVDRLGPVAGVNLEDQLGDPAPLRRRCSSAVKARTPRSSSTPASTPTGSGDGRVDETLERADAYVARRRRRHLRPRRQGRGRDRRAGRGAPGPAQRPVPPGACSVPRLAELGVARISTGSLLYRVALGAAIDAATAIRDGASELRSPVLRRRRRPRR